jgi:hypothetical protein
MFYEDLSDVVLVGHSYGGLVITGVVAEESETCSLGQSRCLLTS